METMLSLSVGWSVVIELVWRDSDVLDLAVHKVVELWLWAAVQFGLDPLRVSVWGQLLCGFIHQEEKGIVLRVRNFKLVRTNLTHFLRSGVRLHLKGFGCAATASILQRNAQVVLNIDKKKSCKESVTPNIYQVCLRTYVTCAGKISLNMHGLIFIYR